MCTVSGLCFRTDVFMLHYTMLVCYIVFMYYVCKLAYVIRARGASPHGAGAARTAQTSSLRLSARQQQIKGQRSEEALLQTMRRYRDGSFP